MPAWAAVEHVEDDVLVDEQEITLDLLIEGVRDIHTAHVGMRALSSLTSTKRR